MDLVEKRRTYKNFGDFTKNLWHLDFVIAFGLFLLFFNQMILEGLVNWDRNSDEFVIEILTSLMFCALGHRMGFQKNRAWNFKTACMYVLRIRLTGVHVCLTELAESIITTGVATSTIQTGELMLGSTWTSYGILESCMELQTACMYVLRIRLTVPIRSVLLVVC